MNIFLLFLGGMIGLSAGGFVSTFYEIGHLTNYLITGFAAGFMATWGLGRIDIRFEDSSVEDNIHHVYVCGDSFILETFVSEIRNYRNKKLLSEIITKLLGQPINESTVRQILNPFIGQLDNKRIIPYEYTKILRSEFRRFAQDPTNAIQRYHDTEPTAVISRNSVDAILLAYANESLPNYVSITSKDLLPQRKSKK